MKTIVKRQIVAIVLFLICVIPVLAQGYTRGHFSVGWQYGSPFATDFADNPSGYGMSFDGGYYINPFLSVGGFVSFQRNYEYVPRATYPVGETGSVTTDQQHCLHQIPFGAYLRYRLFTGTFQPFFGIKAGANYMYAYSDLPTARYYDDTWGFHLSPEIGVAIFPFKDSRLGFNIAGYYSYSTNQSMIFSYDMNGVNNAGFRLGLIF